MTAVVSHGIYKITWGVNWLIVQIFRFPLWQFEAKSIRLMHVNWQLWSIFSYIRKKSITKWEKVIRWLTRHVTQNNIHKIPLRTNICKIYLILEIHVMSVKVTMNIHEFISSQNQNQIVIVSQKNVKSKLRNIIKVTLSLS